MQTTADLAGFWATSYEAVKREMKGRYPKHLWPDDPAATAATRLSKATMDRRAKEGGGGGGGGGDKKQQQSAAQGGGGGGGKKRR